MYVLIFLTFSTFYVNIGCMTSKIENISNKVSTHAMGKKSKTNVDFQRRLPKIREMYITLLCTSLHSFALPCFTLHSLALQCCALRCLTLPLLGMLHPALTGAALLCVAITRLGARYVAMHCIALPCSALLCCCLTRRFV